MISTIVPYVLTFMGLIIDGVHDFLGMAIFLTVIGVIWTGIAGLVKDYSKKGILIAEGVHGVIWIMCKFFPMFGAKLLGGITGLLIGAVVLIFAYIYILEPMFSGNHDSGDSPWEQEPSGGNGQMPNIIYDSNNREWHCLNRFANGEAEYHDKSGNTIHIYHSNVEGNSAATSEGVFHWY